MTRILVIDQDRAAMESLGLACLEREMGVVMAENVCEGVRALGATAVSMIVVDQALLRLTPAEHAAVFERVAPGADVVVVAGSETPLAARVGCELAGFAVLTRPVDVDDLIAKAGAPAGMGADR